MIPFADIVQNIIYNKIKYNTNKVRHYHFYSSFFMYYLHTNTGTNWEIMFAVNVADSNKKLKINQ